MIDRYVKEDITKTPIKQIAHGVNCQNAMGAGVAKALFTKWPKVKEQYHDDTTMLINQERSFQDFFGENRNSNKGLLGKICAVRVNDDAKIVWNLYTQEFYGRDPDVRYCSYEAIEKCFVELNRLIANSKNSSVERKELYEKFGDTIAIPKIGCGLAGGDWKEVSQIIEKATPDLSIVVYDPFLE